MPTVHERTQVTITPELAQAMAIGSRNWPQLSQKSALITRLGIEGARSLATRDDDLGLLVRRGGTRITMDHIRAAVDELD